MWLMSNKHFISFMALFCGAAGVLSIYAALWYVCREIYGTAGLWLILAIDLFARVVSFVNKLKELQHHGK